MSSLMNRVTRFARGPEGRSALQKAMDRFGGGRSTKGGGRSTKGGGRSTKGGGRSTRGRSTRRTAGRGRARTKRTR
jgi:hypothetical protein